MLQIRYNVLLDIALGKIILMKVLQEAQKEQENSEITHGS